MIYSLDDLRRRQMALYESLRRRQPRKMRPIASARGETLVTLSRVLLDEHGEPHFGLVRAHLLPDPGLPPDLPIDPEEQIGFPVDLMELRLESAAPVGSHIVRATYPYTWGHVDVDQLRPRPQNRADVLELRREAQGLVEAGSDRVVPFLRRLPMDLWNSAHHPRGLVARPVRPPARSHPVAGRTAVESAARIVEQLPPTRSEEQREPFVLVAVCEDVDTCLRSLVANEVLQALASRARPVLDQHTDDLLAASALWALTGHPFEPEPVGDGPSLVMGKSVVKRASFLFRTYGMRLAHALGTAEALVESGLRFTASDNVHDAIDEDIAGTWPLAGAADEARLQLRASSESDRIRGLVRAGSLVLTMRKTDEDLVTEIRTCASQDPSAKVRRWAEEVLRLIQRS